MSDSSEEKEAVIVNCAQSKVHFGLEEKVFLFLSGAGQLGCLQNQKVEEDGKRSCPKKATQRASSQSNLSQNLVFAQTMHPNPISQSYHSNHSSYNDKLVSHLPQNPNDSGIIIVPRHALNMLGNGIFCRRSVL
mmetsp:Transcript_11241/g.42084  ORF Transcript_11241/g.42084 Transcript_11241/m.42084 type:complete len:134 (+) Transcript_11241:2635-3036(+)